MTSQKGRIGLRVAAAASAALMGLAVTIPPGQSGALARGLTAVRPAADECEGDACAAVSVTFDESKQQYRVQNNSADRWVRVTASNMAGSASACLTPGGASYLPLKSISGAYRAAYAEARCGEAESSGPPSGE